MVGASPALPSWSCVERHVPGIEMRLPQNPGQDASGEMQVTGGFRMTYFAWGFGWWACGLGVLWLPAWGPSGPPGGADVCQVPMPEAHRLEEPRVPCPPGNPLSVGGQAVRRPVGAEQ